MTKQYLLEQLQAAQQENKNLEEILYAIKKILWGSRCFEYNYNDIVDELLRLENRVSKNEGVELQASRQYAQENERLWSILKLIVIPTDKLQELSKQDISRMNQFDERR